MKKKIILLSRKTFPGSQSIEYLFKELYQEFQTLRLNVKAKQLPYYSKGLFNRIFNALYVLTYRNKIVHVTGDVHYAILGAWFSKRVLTIHDLSFLERTKGLKNAILKLFWVSLPVKFAHQITTVSESTKQDILKIIPNTAQKITVIPNFIDDIFKPTVRFFNSSNPRILHIGTAFNKNLDRLAEALSGIECTLIIMGALDQQQKIKLHANNIQYENKLNLSWDQLFQEYQQADLLAFVSTIEGFGMPIIEAQASGLPVITSNISAMPEVAADAALLVDPFDVDAIRKGIMTMINNDELRAILVKKGYQNAAQYRKENIAKQYVQLYDSLI